MASNASTVRIRVVPLTVAVAVVEPEAVPGTGADEDVCAAAAANMAIVMAAIGTGLSIVCSLSEPKRAFQE